MEFHVALKEGLLHCFKGLHETKIDTTKTRKLGSCRLTAMQFGLGENRSHKPSGLGTQCIAFILNELLTD